ncbi:hypothetical protein TREES_T100017848 [Tupaia chinensis]|uniref:Uncharacterized protein n=1 Tax=Tupaia chinensis TaxID=246437 RepID=L9KFK5_TUPCH|nr:hypothetical protein TREES_T100017848 [Tupaia chinensis]
MGLVSLGLPLGPEMNDGGELHHRLQCCQALYQQELPLCSENAAVSSRGCMSCVKGPSSGRGSRASSSACPAHAHWMPSALVVQRQKGRRRGLKVQEGLPALVPGHQRVSERRVQYSSHLAGP